MPSYLDEQFELKGKVTVVIGATGELGGALAEGLCRAGATTVFSGRNATVGTERAKRLDADPEAGTAAFLPCDTTSRKALRYLVEAVDKQFGRLDVLVNSAGVNAATPFLTPFLEVTEDEWDRIMDTNLKGVFLACQIFGEYLLDRGEGESIINISSMSGITPLSKVFTYSASKAALINLTQNLAREWAPERIRVNCIAPGFFAGGAEPRDSHWRTYGGHYAPHARRPLRQGRGADRCDTALGIRPSRCLYHGHQPGGGWWLLSHDDLTPKIFAVPKARIFDDPRGYSTPVVSAREDFVDC